MRVKRDWTENTMSSAVAAVKSGMSIRKAAQTFSVPKSTLADRTNGRISEGSKMGRPSFLSKTTEEEIISVAHKRADLGIGFSKSNFLRFSGILAQKNGKGFKRGNPSNMWWRRLKQRHPSFALRAPEATATIRHDAMSRDRLTKYFDSLKGVIEMHNFNLFPERIWNMDETGINLFHKPSHVIAKKGAKTVHGKASGIRETITVIACVNGNGDYIPPHFIVPGKSKKKLHGFDLQAANGSAIAGARFSVSDSGWTKEGIGKLWFSESFIKAIGPERPQLLIFDGHSSHNNIEFIELARRENIILVELPSHTSNWTQPLDRSVFKSLKAYWNSELDTFIRMTGIAVGHAQFVKTFGNAWEKSMTRQNITNGFKSTGIHPFNPNAIPESAYLPSDTLSAATTTQTDNNTDLSTTQANSITVDVADSEVTENGTNPYAVNASFESDTLHINSISEVTLSVPLNTEGLYDLNLMLDPNGTLLPTNETPIDEDLLQELTSQENEEASTEVSTESEALIECTDKKALEVIESTLPSETILKFSAAILSNQDANHPLFQTWKTYKLKETKCTEYTNVQSVAQEHFPLPVKSIKRKPLKDSYFVISADDAYREKINEIEQRKRVKEEKENKKLEKNMKRMLKKMENTQKQKLREEKKKSKQSNKSKNLR